MEVNYIVINNSGGKLAGSKVLTLQLYVRKKSINHLFLEGYRSGVADGFLIVDYMNKKLADLMHSKQNIEIEFDDIAYKFTGCVLEDRIDENNITNCVPISIRSDGFKMKTEVIPIRFSDGIEYVDKSHARKFKDVSNVSFENITVSKYKKILKQLLTKEFLKDGSK